MSTNPPNIITSDRFKEILARARAAAGNIAQKAVIDEISASISSQSVDTVSFSGTGISDSKISVMDEAAEEAAVEFIREITEVNDKENHTHKIAGVARSVVLNEKQNLFKSTVISGVNCILIGAAGTGKTTSVRETTEELISIPGRLPVLQAEDETKWLRAGVSGAVIISYTRKAVNNIRMAVTPALRDHVVTIHKLIEFAPVIYTIEDPNNPGIFKNTMVFEPKRNADNPLPRNLVLVLHEESSMESTALYSLLEAALPHPHQEVFLGDIQQLPPVFGSAILGFKMSFLETIELTEVYRQALDSPILSLAHKILAGDPNDFKSTRESYDHTLATGKTVKRFRVPAYDNLSGKQFAEDGTVISELIIQPWQKKLSVDDGVNTAVKQLTVWADNNYYNPNEDIILCPFNKAFGCIELNKGISQHLGIKRNAIVHEVIAGFNKHYLAIGDRVLFDKEDAYITEINRNGSYLGTSPKASSISLDRWGHYQDNLSDTEILQHQIEQEEEADIDRFDLVMEAAALDISERVTAASHCVTIEFAYGERDTVTLDAAAEINNLLGGYVITPHKFQGSEVERGFIIMHHTHGVLNFRELLYTAVTRYKKFLHFICEPDTLEKGVASQRIKGQSLEDKIEFFKGKVDAGFNIAETERNGDLYVYDPGAIVKQEPVITPVTVSEKQRDVISISAEPDKPKSVIIDWSLRVTEEVKVVANRNIKEFWDRARIIYGDEVGPIPNVSYNLHKQGTLGEAYLEDNNIRLNAIWCCMAPRKTEIWNEMLVTTLFHEACHMIARRFCDDTGHGTGWISTMKLMGQKPNQFYDDGSLPAWTDSYKELMMEMKNEANREEQPSVQDTSAGSESKYPAREIIDDAHRERNSGVMASSEISMPNSSRTSGNNSTSDLVARAKERLANIRAGKSGN